MSKYRSGWLDEVTADKTFAEAKAINDERLKAIRKAKKTKK